MNGILTFVLAITPNLFAEAVYSDSVGSHPTIEQRFGVKADQMKIEIKEWRHWTSKKRPKSEILRELRAEIREFVFVSRGDRARLEKTNSLLGYHGSGTFTLPSGVRVPWKHKSTLLEIQIPAEISNGRSYWQDFAPLSWVKQLEKERGTMPN